MITKLNNFRYKQNEPLYTNKNIPSSIKSEIVSDIQNVKKLKLAYLVANYPEVDSDYLSDLFDSLK